VNKDGWLHWTGTALGLICGYLIGTGHYVSPLFIVGFGTLVTRLVIAGIYD